MKPYERTAHYYETDKMGIVHHSNYIRWFEETRVYFLAQAGYSYEKMEENGVMIPVQSVNVQYKNAVRFGETVIIAPKVEEFNGFRLCVSYRIVGKENGDLKATGETRHFFTDTSLKPIRTKSEYPEIYKVFHDNIGIDFLEGQDGHNEDL
ncbi:MAG: acyl-CoA thioesterase [Oscillospiraceae bacterium]|nr:acyl-CoA thioesterase [Oscillospiraceae bacterium]